MIYFIADTSGRVKIGFSRNINRRLRALQTGSADSLTVIRVIDGGKATERWLHKHFSDFRIDGEWFERIDLMLTVTPPTENNKRQTNALDKFLSTNRITNAEFAQRIGVCAEAVRKYRANERWPRVRHLRAIAEATCGLVQPNDFLSPCSSSELMEPAE